MRTMPASFPYEQVHPGRSHCLAEDFRPNIRLESQNRMRRAMILIGVCLLVVGLSFLAVLASRQRAAKPKPGSTGPKAQPHLVGFSLVREVTPEATFSASLTNHYGVPIYLRGHAIQYEDNQGQIMNGPRGWGMVHPWLGITNFDTLPPNAVAKISFHASEIPANAKRTRLVFQYFYDAGPLTRAASHIVTNLPVGSLSQEERYWLYQAGFLSGQHQRSYDGDWVSNESVQRMEASLSALETNSTPVSAGSHR